MDLNLLAGPAALAIASTAAVIALWRAHVKSDDLDKATIKALAVTVGEFPAAMRELTAIVADAAARARKVDG